MRLRALLLFVWCAALPAADGWTVQIAAADPVVRQGLIWRCRITGDIPESRFDQPTYVVQISLAQGGATLATQEFPLTRLGQLHGGIDVVLVPGAPAQVDAPVELAVTVSDPARRDLQHVTRSLPTPIGIQRGLERRQRLLRERRDADPLPALWLEQAGELMLGGTTLAACRQLLTIGEQLDRWLAGERPTTILRALRDPLDGSVQPYRLHLADAGTPTALVVLLADSGAVRKSAWPSAEHAWIAAARAEHAAVLEVYPAGDAGWDGVARTRVWSTISAARVAEPRLATLPLVLVGSGRGAAGALALAEEHPLRIQGLGLIDGRLPESAPLPADPHGRWLALHRAGERPAHLPGMTVVVDGGDAATRDWSRRVGLGGHLPVTTAGAAATAGFWGAVLAPAPAPARRDWLVLEPGEFGALRVEELADWGIAGSLTHEAGAVRTHGIGRLRLSAPVPSVDDRPYRDPGAAPPPPRKALGQALGPLDGYARGPFTVVIGTGESAAAQADNRALGQAFAAAWAAHAHGRVRMVEDTGLDERALPGHHLVLIGNLRSNRLLELLAARSRLPIAWDARAVTVAGQTFLRSERRSVALAWPHPAHDGRLLVILDGRPAWRDTGLPLAGLPDLVIGGPQAGDPPVFQRTFGNDWR